MYIPRNIEPLFSRLLKDFPVVTILGPRQSGKTTLVKNFAADKPYINLDDLDVLHKIQEDPKGILQSYAKTGVIIDEVQRMPELLSYIQVQADEINKAGQFILTGSNQLALSNNISQTLAGRTAILSLLPFSIAEIEPLITSVENNSQLLDSLLLNGFYPRIYTNKQKAYDLYKFYLQTYIERDVRQLIKIKHLMDFQKFMRLCAGRVGQILNIHSLSNEVGVTSNTIKEWLSVLESAYIIYLLRPYHDNFGKRMIKSPKLYFTDVGLASYLLEIYDLQHIKHHPLRGNLFENLVVMDLYKGILNNDIRTELYYFRDSNQNEVDLLFKLNGKLYPLEIKSSATFATHFLKGIKYIKSITGDLYGKGFLVYSGVSQENVSSVALLNYMDLKHVW